MYISVLPSVILTFTPGFFSSFEVEVTLEPCMTKVGRKASIVIVRFEDGMRDEPPMGTV